MTMKPIPKGEVVTDSIAKTMDRRYLSSLDLIGVGQVELTIDRVEYHKEITFNNEKKKKNVHLMYFKETEKPLDLNVTNITAVTYLLKSNKPSDWAGKKIKLEVKRVQKPGGRSGEKTNGVRVVG